MPEQVVEALIAHGPIGVLALVSTFVAYKLWLKVDALQDKRIEDVEKYMTSTHAVTTALERNTDAMERTLDRLAGKG